MNAQKGTNNGLALVAVLWMVVVMTAIVAVMSQTSRLNMKMATAATDELRSWMKKFEAVLEVVLKGHPSLIEILGPSA